MVTEARLEQPEKASHPIDVTLLGMVMEVNPEQNAKAELPMDVTLLGITVVLHPKTSLFVDVSIIALQPSRES